MATQVQWRRGSTAEHASFTGAVGEITVDTDKDVVVVHDGSTVGGFPTPRADEVVDKTAATGSAVLPKGTTAQRDVSPDEGYVRFNTTLEAPEYFDGTDWSLFGQGLPVYDDSSIPTSNVGPIYVEGIGIREWVSAVSQYFYAPKAALPRGWRFGGTLTSTTTSVTATAFTLRGFADTYDIISTGPLTKILQNTGGFAIGDSENGLFTGARANNTWYHVYAIRRDSDGLVDMGFDTSDTAANRPSGWSEYRLLGSVRTNGSGNILSFVQVGSEFTWVARVADVTEGAASTSGTTHTISVPPGRRVKAHVGTFLTFDSGGQSFISLSSPDSIPATVGGSGAYADHMRGTTSLGQHMNAFSVVTGTSSQVVAKGSSNISTAFSLNTRGWTDFLGEL